MKKKLSKRLGVALCCILEEEKRAKAQKKLTGPIVVSNSGPDGYSAKLFSSLEKDLFLFSGVGTSNDVRCRVLYADG